MAIEKLETVYVRLVEDAHNGDLVDIRFRCYDCYENERINDTEHADDYRAALPGEISEDYDTHCELCSKLLVRYVEPHDPTCETLCPYFEEESDGAGGWNDYCSTAHACWCMEAPSVPLRSPSAVAPELPGFRYQDVGAWGANNPASPAFVPANDIEARFVAEGGDPRDLDIEPEPLEFPEIK